MLYLLHHLVRVVPHDEVSHLTSHSPHSDHARYEVGVEVHPPAHHEVSVLSPGEEGTVGVEDECGRHNGTGVVLVEGVDQQGQWEVFPHQVHAGSEEHEEGVEDEELGQGGGGGWWVVVGALGL